MTRHAASQPTGASPADHDRTLDDLELRQAARRLRAGRSSTIYNYQTSEFKMQFIEDLSHVADAWLAANPEDDDDPVSVEWLIAEGFESTVINNRYEVLLKRGLWLTVDVDSSRELGLSGDGHATLKRRATNGDVRAARKLLSPTGE